MSSITGFVNYINYTAGSTKGDVEYGDVLNGAFGLGYDRNTGVTKNTNGEYTSSKVTSNGNAASSTTDFTLDWSPIVPGTVTMKYGTTTAMDIDKDGELYEITGNVTTSEVVDRNGNVTVTVTGGTKGSKVGTVVYGNTRDGAAQLTPELRQDAGNDIKGKITLTSGITGDYTITYVYNNVYIPQNDIPLLNARMESIPLFARARRIAVYYSQMAAFQASF